MGKRAYVAPGPLPVHWDEHTVLGPLSLLEPLAVAIQVSRTRGLQVASAPKYVFFGLALHDRAGKEHFKVSQQASHFPEQADVRKKTRTSSTSRGTLASSGFRNHKSSGMRLLRTREFTVYDSISERESIGLLEDTLMTHKHGSDSHKG